MRVYYSLVQDEFVYFVGGGLLKSRHFEMNSNVFCREIETQLREMARTVREAQRKPAHKVQEPQTSKYHGDGASD